MVDRHWKYTVCTSESGPFTRTEDVVLTEAFKVGLDAEAISCLLRKRPPHVIRRRRKTLLTASTAHLPPQVPSFTEFYRVLSDFTRFYRVLPSFTEFYRVLPSFT